MQTELQDRSLGLGVAIIKQLRQVPSDLFTKKNREQLSSSATSIGANIAEARSGQSRADFISKLEIALKEARETDYWLTVLDQLTDKKDPALVPLLQECNEVTAMLVASIKTAKMNVLNTSLPR